MIRAMGGGTVVRGHVFAPEYALRTPVPGALWGLWHLRLPAKSLGTPEGRSFV